MSGSSLSCLYTSSGDLTISGGTVVVWIANTADDQPLDADGTLTVSGGTILAAGGSAGMGVSTSATQPYVIFGSIGGMGRGPMGGGTSALAAKGSSFSIQDSSGSTVYSGTALCSANYVFSSSSKLSADASYTLCSGSTSAATATAQTGTASADLTGFSDQAAISSFARPTMSWAKASGLMDGNDTGALAPKGAATRAQMTMILTRLCEKAV